MSAGTPLTAQAFAGSGAVIVVLAVLLFGASGAADYWQAWIYLAVFAVSVFAITGYFLARSPEFIARRLRAGPGAETEASQKVIQSLASLCFILIDLVAGLDRRLGWSGVPALVALAGDIVAATGFWVVFRTFRENEHASATIEVAAAQEVVASGPYAIVRHPMYAGAGLLLLASGPALDSLWAILPAALLMAAIVWRLIDEERFLSANLAGYGDYCRRTRYRLIPRVW